MNKEEIYYLSGPMSITNLPDYNHSEFDRITKILRDAGLKIVNPAELSPVGKYDKWEDYLICDITYILKHKIRNIILMEGWEMSEGAMIEIFNVLKLLKGNIYLLHLYEKQFRLEKLAMDFNYIIKNIDNIQYTDFNF